MKSDFIAIPDGDLCSPLGFEASGVKAGLKKSGNPDIALIHSKSPSSAAALFTKCRFPAAPVQISKKHLAKSRESYRAVVINSGNANACTGKSGLENASEMAKIAARELSCDAGNVLVCSTGRIGVPLPMNLIASGIPAAAAALSRKGGGDACAAIMTTDTFPKRLALSMELSGKKVTLAGMAKGAGMIAPDMKGLHATMICVITSDVAIAPRLLQKLSNEACEESFNRITVDGDTSTNDTVIVLANGMAGNPALKSAGGDSAKFAKALSYLMTELAKQIVLDGEGATKFVSVKVEKAASKKDALLCARTVANSLLCKTAWFGADPNWGRILAAAGRSGAKIKPDSFELYFDHLCAVSGGMASDVPECKLAEILKNDEFTVRIVLNCGDADCEVWTNDISYDYVKINADYHT